MKAPESPLAGRIREIVDSLLSGRPAPPVGPPMTPERPEVSRPPVALAPDPIAAYRATLGRLWALNVKGADADPGECAALLQEQARLLDEIGPAFAEAVSRQAARAWATRERRCPFCGIEGVYHDPETALPAAGQDVKAGPVVPLDASGWPDALPGLGARRPGPFTPCSTCGTGIVAVDGTPPLCRVCAGGCHTGEDATP